MNELPVGAKMLGAVASGCREAEKEIGNQEVRVVTIAYDPVTGGITLASSHGKEATTAALGIALNRYSGLEVRKSWKRKRSPRWQAFIDQQDKPVKP